MSKATICEGCGADTVTSAHAPDCPATRVVITDKRGRKKDQDEFAKGAVEGTLTDEQMSEFERQQAEEAARLAAWAAMSDEEKQAVLAQQAAENEGTPYQGAGMQNEGEMKKAVMTAFVVMIDLDGMAYATNDLAVLDTISYERDATPPDMYRACAEIMGDIQAGATAMQVMKFMGQQAAAMQQQAQQQALASRLAQRRMNK